MARVKREFNVQQDNEKENSKEKQPRKGDKTPAAKGPQGDRRKEIKQTAKKNKGENVPFIRSRMWINLLLSALQKDRGTIPLNIGNRIMITNNMYITRYYMMSLIQVEVLSLKTPVTFVSELNYQLRKNKSNAICDVTFKNTAYDINLNDTGLKSRINMWENALESEFITDNEKETAARCLYTRDIVRQGVPLMKTRLFIRLMAKTGTELTEAEKIVGTYLSSIEAKYKIIVGNIKDTLQFMSILSDRKSKELKDIKAIVNSPQTLAQMLPNSGSFNGSKGLYLGINQLNGSEFNQDLSNITGARNIYCTATSGEGKTAITLNLCCSAREQGMSVCVQDIKGNEFTSFVLGTGGYVVSMRQTSRGYINSWKMNKEDTNDRDAEMYFKQRISFSKEQIMILSGITDPMQKIELEELLDAFHDSLYISLGVTASNRNSWEATKVLNPYVVYDRLVDFMTPTMQAQYSSISRQILNSLRITMSRNGSKSYLFGEEFDYASIMKAPTLMFDFGILEGATDLKDTTIFKLKFAYMRKLNAEYSAYKYARGIKVLKVLEEAQIAANDPDIMRGYVEEFTLRRAQGQTTVLLGNSVSALTDSELAKSLIENVTALLIGGLGKKAKDLVISTFGLEEYKDMIYSVGREEFKNGFVYINNMEERAAVPLLKVRYQTDKKYKLLTPVSQNDNFLDVGGGKR